MFRAKNVGNYTFYVRKNGEITQKRHECFFEIEKLEFRSRALRRELLDSARSPRSSRDGRLCFGCSPTKIEGIDKIVTRLIGLKRFSFSKNTFEISITNYFYVCNCKKYSVL